MARTPGRTVASRVLIKSSASVSARVTGDPSALCRTSLEVARADTMILPAATAVAPKARANSSREGRFIRYDYAPLPARQHASGTIDTGSDKSANSASASIAMHEVQLIGSSKSIRATAAFSQQTFHHHFTIAWNVSSAILTSLGNFCLRRRQKRLNRTLTWTPRPNHRHKV